MAKPLVLKAFVIAALRRASYKWPPRYNTMNAARVERGKYKCNLCAAVVGRKDIRLDHVNCVVDPNKGFTNWDDYINRMFVEESGWQAICLSCDKKKQDVERAIRRQTRSNNKKS